MSRDDGNEPNMFETFTKKETRIMNGILLQHRGWSENNLKTSSVCLICESTDKEFIYFIKLVNLFLKESMVSNLWLKCSPGLKKPQIKDLLSKRFNVDIHTLTKLCFELVLHRLWFEKPPNNSLGRLVVRLLDVSSINLVQKHQIVQIHFSFRQILLFKPNEKEKRKNTE